MNTVTNGVLERIISDSFDESYIAVVQGNRDVNTALLRERYDIIFFTGSPELGRVVMRAAAENLTPVVLELGGKSPVVVDKSANIKLAAKRVAWGKTLNAGQTCIAPDYLLIHPDVKEKFIAAYAEAIGVLSSWVMLCVRSRRMRSTSLARKRVCSR